MPSSGLPTGSANEILLFHHLPNQQLERARNRSMLPNYGFATYLATAPIRVHRTVGSSNTCHLPERVSIVNTSWMW